MTSWFVRCILTYESIYFPLQNHPRAGGGFVFLLLVANAEGEPIRFVHGDFHELSVLRKQSRQLLSRRVDFGGLCLEPRFQLLLLDVERVERIRLSLKRVRRLLGNPDPLHHVEPLFQRLRHKPRIAHQLHNHRIIVLCHTFSFALFLRTDL